METNSYKSAGWLGMRAAIVMVVLAIRTGFWPLRSSRICPVSLYIKMDSVAVMADGFALTVRMGVGFWVGVGVMDMKVEVLIVSFGVDPLNRCAPSGVKMSTGTAMMVLIEMNSRAIATERRIINPPGQGKSSTTASP